MAGHSQFKNIMYRKGAQDRRKAKVFSKLIKEITVAAKEGGTDMEHNPRLRTAIIAARAENMPKDNIDRALKKVEGGEVGSNFENVRYEGYGPEGVAIIVDALTDNKNRTAGEVRTIFGKNGGVLGETNSVAFLFNRVGCIRYSAEKILEDEIFEVALSVGADNIFLDDGEHEIICGTNVFRDVRDALILKFGEPKFANIIWKPQNLIVIEDLEKAKILMNFIEILDDNEDVQNVTGNFTFSKDLMTHLNSD